jgi:hypothetical protein
LSVAALALASAVCALAQQAEPAITLADAHIAPTANALHAGGPHHSGEVRQFQPAKVGQSSPTQIFMLNMQKPTTIARITASDDFHVTGGTCIEGHNYAAHDVCSVEIAFTPAGPGYRTGKLTVTDSVSPRPLLVPVGGQADGPAISFTPAEIKPVTTTLVGGTGLLLNAQGLAIDGGDNLYIADTGNNLIRFQDSSGALSVYAGGGTGNAADYDGLATGVRLNGPRGVVVDSSQSASIADTGDSVVLRSFIDGLAVDLMGQGSTNFASCFYTSPCSSPSSLQISAPYNMFLDPSGNLFTSYLYPEGTVGFAIGETDSLDTSPSFYLDSTSEYNYYSSSSAIAADGAGNRITPILTLA